MSKLKLCLLLNNGEKFENYVHFRKPLGFRSLVKKTTMGRLFTGERSSHSLFDQLAMGD